jgi:hypothetical protein
VSVKTLYKLGRFYALGAFPAVKKGKNALARYHGFGIILIRLCVWSE